MNDQTINVLKTIPSDQLREISRELCNQLINKGLSFGQAEALLEYAKDLLKGAKI